MAAAVGGGSGGTADAAPADAPAVEASGPDTGAGGTGVMAANWYEAEAVPPNKVSGSSKVSNCSAGPCPSLDAIKEGAECCSGGKKIGNILGRTKSSLEIANISAPADGMYDVTWWFHCGKNDNFGDRDCGGRPHTPSGCRPHQIVVNGSELPGTYHFPCFAGSWGEIHASTTTVPLKAGTSNTIRVYVKAPYDAADMDALQVFPAGKGVTPLIPSTPR